MNPTNSQAVSTAGRELVMTRLLNAPRELVFKVWTEPQHMAQWWGPNGFTNTVHELNFKPGGALRFTMHGPDGTDYKNKIVYIEIVPPERLIYSHGGEDEDESEPFHVTVTFDEEAGNKTRLNMHTVFSTVEEFERVKAFGAVEGGNQTLNRLEAYLAQQG